MANTNIMEDIKYVDISVNDIVGDIPTGNSLRIKPTKEGAMLCPQESKG